MSAFDDAKVETATRMITRYGKDLTVSVPGDPTYVPATRSSSSTPTVRTVKAVMIAVPLRKFGKGEDESEAGSVREAMAFLMAGSEAMLPVGASVTVDGQSFAVVESSADWCGERVVLWTVIIGRA